MLLVCQLMFIVLLSCGTTEKVELRFTSKNRTNPEVVFELYNLEQDSLSMSGELQFAEKWQSIIGKKLLDKTSKMDK